MQLLNVPLARSVWLFAIEDLNPRGKSIFPELFDWIKKTYHFEKVPKTIDDLDSSKGLAFSNGGYQVAKEQRPVGVAFKIYSDGMIAETRSSTDDSNAFLANLLEAGAKEFSLNWDSSMIRKKRYISELSVKCESNLRTIRPELEDFSRKISTLTEWKWELAQIGFWPDPNLHTLAAPQLPVFRFERQQGYPFSENRYFSSGPFETKIHLELLNDLEKILAEQAR